MRGGRVGRILRVCTALAAIHSLLTSKPAKDQVRRIAGHRYRNGLYRLFFNAQSVLCLAWAAQRFFRLPDREIYRVGAPWSWLFRAGQVASLGVLLSAVQVIGVLNFTGISQPRSFLAGLGPDAEPEAQGPPLGVDGQMVTAWVFRFTRHPSNQGVLGVFLFFSRITVNRVTLVVALHVVWGHYTKNASCERHTANLSSGTDERCRFWYLGCGGSENLLAFLAEDASIVRISAGWLRTHLRYGVDLLRSADPGSPGTAVTAFMAVAS